VLDFKVFVVKTFNGFKTTISYSSDIYRMIYTIQSLDYSNILTSSYNNLAKYTMISNRLIF